jgi:hypothetical protein
MLLVDAPSQDEIRHGSNAAHIRRIKIFMMFDKWLRGMQAARKPARIASSPYST